jgi:hypothetical protein
MTERYCETLVRVMGKPPVTGNVKGLQFELD